MEWQVMTAKIKELERLVSSTLSSISNLIALNEVQQGRIARLESYLQADPAFLPYGELQKRVSELEDNVESLTRSMDLWQEVSGIEVLVSVSSELPEQQGGVIVDEYPRL